MKAIQFFFITICICTNLKGQDYSLEYGKVTKNELTLSSYPYDKTAAAAILFDQGKSSFVCDFDYNFILVFERITKIKIFSEAGLKYAEIEIPYYHDDSNFEKVEKIEAITYNLVDDRTQITHFDPKNTFIEKINENWDLLKFAIPDAKPGSVIEYKYTVTSPFKFNFHDWYFQSDIPTKYSKYVAAMIPFYTYTFLLQGAQKFDYQNTYESGGITQHYGPVEYHDNINEYVMSNIPAFTDEGFITTKEDYIIKLDFQLSKIFNTSGQETDVVSTWPILCNELLKYPDFGKYINSSQGNNNELITRLKSEETTDLELAEAIVDYVKQNYSWNSYNSKYTSQSVKEFEKTKIGNSADINLYLLGMLNDAGLVAYPVILSTRDHGKIKADVPFMDFFNYVVLLVQIGTDNILVDATEPLLPFNLIPPKCINDQGLIVKKKSTEWVALNNNIPSLIQTVIKCELNVTHDSLNTAFNVSSTRYDGFYLRKEINDDNKKLSDYIEKKGLLQNGISETKNFYDRNKPFFIKFSGSFPLERILDKIYFAPFLTEPITVNPMTQSERKYPVDYTYAKKREFYSSFIIPEGYKTEFIPSDKQIDDKNFSFIYQINISEDGKSIFIHAAYTFKNTVYDAKEYGLLRYYYSELVKKLNEKIVLVKNES